MSQGAGGGGDFLYGGSLDIAIGGGGQIPFSLIRAAAFFYDAIIVPDGFFTCDGPLFRHLYGLFKDPKSPRTDDEIVTYLRRGIIRPNLRRGENLADVWFYGSDVGVTPGQFLTVPAAVGDPVFEALATLRIPFVNWPDDMQAAFGSRLADVFLSEDGEMNLV